MVVIVSRVVAGDYPDLPGPIRSGQLLQDQLEVVRARGKGNNLWPILQSAMSDVSLTDLELPSLGELFYFLTPPAVTYRKTNKIKLITNFTETAKQLVRRTLRCWLEIEKRRNNEEIRFFQRVFVLFESDRVLFAYSSDIDL